jgi:hypothetical protein
MLKAELIWMLTRRVIVLKQRISKEEIMKRLHMKSLHQVSQISQIRAVCLMSFVLVSFMAREVRADFASDCASLMSALVDAGREDKWVQRMLDPRAGKNEFFLDQELAPWIGYYFPFVKGGIAVRWQRGQRAPTKLLSEELAGSSTSVTKNAVIEKLRAMSKEERNLLSPAEKMDIYLGQYDFPITVTELTRRGPRRAPSPQEWEGFCNGRCAAGMLTREPVKPISVRNADGIEITFQPNDIKALITASYFYVEKYAQMGVPNMSKIPRVDGRVDAAAFDIALRSFLGESQRPFVVDIDPTEEIWNHLAVGYKRVLGAEVPVPPDAQGLPARAKFEVSARLTVYYINDLHNIARHNKPTVDMVRKDNYTAIFPRHYPYKLYLDENKQIVGGSWNSSKDYPDFVWFPEGRGTDDVQGVNPHLPFDKVMELVEASSSKTSSN